MAYSMLCAFLLISNRKFKTYILDCILSLYANIEMHRSRNKFYRFEKLSKVNKDTSLIEIITEDWASFSENANLYSPDVHDGNSSNRRSKPES